MSAPSSLLWPMLAQIGWTFLLYAWLTLARRRAVKRGEVAYSAYAFNREEPAAVARIRLNLANQFELPVIFYGMVLLLVLLERTTVVDVLAAWVFVLGRVAHTLVQTHGDDVVLRGRVFLINALALAVLVAHVAWIAYQTAA